MGKRSMWFIVLAALVFTTGTGLCAEFDVGGKPATVMGFINQGATFGIAGEHYDTQEGFQSAYFDILFEADYQPASDLKWYGAFSLSGDWAYDLLSDDKDWNNRNFNQSRDELYLDNELREVVQEFHLTWAPGNFYFRAGKQILVWGETDGFRIMDQINPVDQRRGLGDVEFESTIKPLWLVRAEYYLQPESSWLQDLGVELVFNPNADFGANKRIVPGNNVAGIWAPAMETMIPVAFDPVTGAPTAFANARVGSFNTRVDTPDAWDSKGYEFGGRLRAVINDAIVTLNYFNGIDNDMVQTMSGAPTVEIATDGVPILHLTTAGSYERFRIAGATYTRDFPALSASFLGGVAPVLRLEGFYGFGNSFNVADFSRVEKTDEIRYAVGLDWKVKVPFLNPRAYFMISPQVYQQIILDYPGDKNLIDSAGRLEHDNVKSSLFINTSYFHNKVVPSFFWLRDYTRNSNMFRYQVAYEYSNIWNFTLGALFLDGGDVGNGFEPLRNKDQVYFTASYRF